jgi:hypothetical protein
MSQVIAFDAAWLLVADIALMLVLAGAMLTGARLLLASSASRNRNAPQ